MDAEDALAWIEFPINLLHCLLHCICFELRYFVLKQLKALLNIDFSAFTIPIRGREIPRNQIGDRNTASRVTPFGKCFLPSSLIFTFFCP